MQRRAMTALALSAAAHVALHFFGPLVGGESAAHIYTEMILRQLTVWGLPALIMTGVPKRRQLRTCIPLSAAALLTGAAAQWILAWFSGHWQRLTGAQGMRIILPSDPLDWVLAVLALVVVPAVTEEMFFRSGVTSALEKRWSGAGALIGGAVIFALMHGSLAGFPAQLGIGLLLGLCWQAAGSLTACVLLHGSYNAFALIWSLWPAWPGAVSLLVAAALLAVIVYYGCKRVALRRTGSWREALPLLLCCGAVILIRFV